MAGGMCEMRSWHLTKGDLECSGEVLGDGYLGDFVQRSTDSTDTKIASSDDENDIERKDLP